ncbi:MAG TPA: hypothetical protein PK359_12075 [Burkholderiaceae bacterium]|jgi:hypothetical protein|nr:hypothetical protein [Burkholderiaceae bacterium]
MKNRLRLRCLAALSGASALLALGLVAPAAAQLRTFPPKTRVGKFSMMSFPQALLDDRQVQLAPGVRILSTSNALVIPSTLTGEQTVRYRLDPLGQMIEIWLLTPAEADAARREPGTGS